MSTPLHFELKAPEGKLLVVDLETENDVIVAAQISGDFFLEPEAAFEALAPALAGSSITDSTPALTARLDSALDRIASDPPVALHGFSTRDVAVAVKRAVSGGTDFVDHNWEIL